MGEKPGEKIRAVIVSHIRLKERYEGEKRNLWRTSELSLQEDGVKMAL